MTCCDWLWFIESLDDADITVVPPYVEPYTTDDIVCQIARLWTTLKTPLHRGLSLVKARD